MTQRPRNVGIAVLFAGATCLAAIACFGERQQDGANGDSRQRLVELMRQSRSTRTPGEHKALTFEILPAVDDAIRENDFPSALRLASLAAESAGKAGNNHALTLASARRERAAAAAKEFKKVSAALETLRTAPNDPQANLAAGRFTCFVKEDWEVGLAMLARGADARLKGLAARELQREPGSRLALAKGWLEAADAEPRTLAAAPYRRAYHWARQAAADATGEENTAAAQVMDRLPMRYLSDLEETEVTPGPWPIGRKGRTGSPEGTMIEVNRVPSPEGIGMHPPDSGFASAKYRLDGKFEAFESGVAISDHQSQVGGVVVFVALGDGKVLWTSPPIGNWGDAQFCRVGVKGVQTLELRTQVQRGGFGVHAAWLDPAVSR